MLLSVALWHSVASDHRTVRRNSALGFGCVGGPQFELEICRLICSLVPSLTIFSRQSHSGAGDLEIGEWRAEDDSAEYVQCTV